MRWSGRRWGISDVVIASAACSPDERSDIRGGVGAIPDVAALIRATQSWAPSSPRHCERSEAIHSAACGEVDCFAALAMTADIVSRSRGVIRPRFASSFALFEMRAQGRPGACCTRGLVCNMHKEVRTRAYRAAGTLRPSLRNGFTAYFELSPVNGSFATVAGRNLFLPTSRQHRGVRTTRLRRTLEPHTSVAALASIASHRAFVTMANAPHPP